MKKAGLFSQFVSPILTRLIECDHLRDCLHHFCDAGELNFRVTWKSV